VSTDGQKPSFALVSHAVPPAPFLAAALFTLALLPLALAACGEDDQPVQSAPETPGQFGSELTGAEARQAAIALRGYLEARAEHRWARACSYLAKPIRRFLDRAAARSKRPLGNDCPSFIASSTRKLLPSERSVLDRVTVDSARADGDRGYVLYQVPGDGEQAMPIRAEGGRWKLAGLSGTPLAAS